MSFAMDVSPALLAFDLLMLSTLLGLAIATLSSRDPRRAAILFIVFGLWLSLVWARLGAPDVALAEAAIGAGLGGALMLAAARRAAARGALALPPEPETGASGESHPTETGSAWSRPEPVDTQASSRPGKMPPVAETPSDSSAPSAHETARFAQDLSAPEAHSGRPEPMPAEPMPAEPIPPEPMPSEPGAPSSRPEGDASKPEPDDEQPASPRLKSEPIPAKQARTEQPEPKRPKAKRRGPSKAPKPEGNQP